MCSAQLSVVLVMWVVRHKSIIDDTVISGWLSAFIPPVSASIRPLHLLFSDLVSWILACQKGNQTATMCFFPFKHDCCFFLHLVHVVVL